MKIILQAIKSILRNIKDRLSKVEESAKEAQTTAEQAEESARKAQSAIESIPTPAIPDWAELDENAKGFIFNKPCGEVVETTWYQDTVSKNVEKICADLAFDPEATYHFKVDTGYEMLEVSGKFYYVRNTVGFYGYTLTGELPGSYDGPFEVYVANSIEEGKTNTRFFFLANDDIFEYSISIVVGVDNVVVKKLDEQYISDNIQRVGDDVIIPSSTEGSTKKFKITVDDTGAITATEVTE